VADWDLKSFVAENGIKAAKQKTAAALDAVDADLTAFRARGGKLILYHGWNDPAIPAVNTVNYYEEVIARTGRSSADSFTRLYMLPGVQHCADGSGPDMFGQTGITTSNDPQHNARIALENWVEKGNAPDTLIATKHASAGQQSSPAMTRPLCPYPQFARYKGAGDPNRTESFECTNPGK
jgi:feruloyl esterase